MDSQANEIFKVTSTDICMSPAMTESFGLISFETRQVFDYINSILLTSVVCVFGIASNVINIIIFYKQGLDNTMNISFFALAISDLGSLVTLLWSAICVTPPLVNSGLPLDFPDVQYLTGGWPHVCFGHITCWITAYITAERCLCIAIPLKVKQLITPKRTTLIIFIIYLINIFSILPEFAYAYIGLTYNPERNTTIWQVAFREETQYLDGISYILLAVFGTVSFPTVILFTVILVTRLRLQAVWRKNTTRASKQTDVTSKRDVKTMTMVVLIAGVLIVCYTPGVLVSLTTFIVPDFNILGKYVNIWFVTWTFAFFTQGINSSVNIFLYYRMSTKFKTTFHEMFKCGDKTLGDKMGDTMI